MIGVFERAFIAMLALVLSCGWAAGQDVVRDCRAYIAVRPVGAGDAVQGPEFRAVFRGASRAVANEARRAARVALRLCVNRHWEARSDDTAPPECTPFAGVHDYPYSSLFTELRRAFCDANGWDGTHNDVNVLLYVTGNTGCAPDVGIWYGYYEVATGVRMNCPPRTGRDRGTMLLYPNALWVANPYGSINMQVSDHAQGDCIAMCMDQVKCRAWSFRKAVVDGNQRCYLYDHAGGRETNRDYDSGLKR